MVRVIATGLIMPSSCFILNEMLVLSRRIGNILPVNKHDDKIFTVGIFFDVLLQKVDFVTATCVLAYVTTFPFFTQSQCLMTETQMVKFYLHPSLTHHYEDYNGKQGK